ncbi:MAG TPA: hypothetical protein VFV52_00510 [Bacilli bacterium]|nr:hypothetical protein [Bacilli bacterium]
MTNYLLIANLTDEDKEYKPLHDKLKKQEGYARLIPRRLWFFRSEDDIDQLDAYCRECIDQDDDFVLFALDKDRKGRLKFAHRGWLDKKSADALDELVANYLS